MGTDGRDQGCSDLFCKPDMLGKNSVRRIMRAVIHQEKEVAVAERILLQPERIPVMSFRFA